MLMRNWFTRLIVTTVTNLLGQFLFSYLDGMKFRDWKKCWLNIEMSISLEMLKWFAYIHNWIWPNKSVCSSRRPEESEKSFCLQILPRLQSLLMMLFMSLTVEESTLWGIYHSGIRSLCLIRWNDLPEYWIFFFIFGIWKSTLFFGFNATLCLD